MAAELSEDSDKVGCLADYQTNGDGCNDVPNQISQSRHHEIDYRNHQQNDHREAMKHWVYDFPKHEFHVGPSSCVLGIANSGE